MVNFNLIVVTTDLSDYSLRALPYAVGLAQRFDAKLKVLCVNEPVVPVAEAAWTGYDVHATDHQLMAEAKEMLERIVREQTQPGVSVEPVVLSGSVVESVLEFAREQNADLLVMCTHGRTGLSHALMGSTAEAIVRRAPCPVLTLRQPMPVSVRRAGN